MVLSRALARLTSFRPSRTDLLVALFFAALVLYEALFSASVVDPWRHALIGIPAMAALAWRTQVPLLVATIVVGVNPVLSPDGESSISLAFAIVSYSVGRWSRVPRAQLGLLGLIGWFLTALYLEGNGLTPSDVAAAGILIGGTWTIGQIVRQRSTAADEAEGRADALEREHELRSAAIAAEERVRLARELHDVVSHSISVVTVQAQAVRRRLHPEQQREIDDLAGIEHSAREAMVELRRILGVLRSSGDGASLSPQPGLAQLDQLADKVRRTGLSVEVTRDGPEVPLSPGLDLAAYRIIQEGLTNVIKHADASRATVTISRAPSHLDLVVEDDGRGLVNGEQLGQGLAGIRERALLYGGSLEVGDSGAGGVRISARLPVEAP